MGELRRVAASDGVKLAVEAFGAGPPLYAIHGGPANDRKSFGDYLSSVAGYRQLCLLDQRGCGDSDDAPPETYSLPRLASDIEDVRMALGHDHVDLLGHSFGGIVALRYGLQHPGQVGRIILVDASFSGLAGIIASPGAWLLWIRTMRESLKSEPDWVEFHMTHELANKRKSAEVRALLSRAIRYDKKRLRPLMKESTRAFDLRHLIHAGVSLFGIYGRQDRRFIADARRLQRARGHVELLENCGHTPFAEQPDAFHEILQRFLCSSGDKCEVPGA